MNYSSFVRRRFVVTGGIHTLNAIPDNPAALPAPVVKPGGKRKQAIDPADPLVAIELSDTALTTAPTPSRDHFSIYFDRAFVAPELENDQRIETGKANRPGPKERTWSPR